MANLFLADYAKNDEICLDFLRAAVIDGDILWKPIIEELGLENAEWTKGYPFASYWFALRYLANELFEQEFHEEARELYERLLTIYDDPSVREDMWRMDSGLCLNP